MTPHFVTIVDDVGKLAAIIPFEEGDQRFDSLLGKSLGSAAMTPGHKKELMAAYAEALIDRKRKVCRYQTVIDRGKAIVEIQVIRFPDTKASALLLSRVIPQNQNVKLSVREREVLALSVRDKSDVQIAAVLKIARGTVCRHKQNIRQKIGVREWSSAVLWAQKNGLLSG